MSSTSPEYRVNTTTAADQSAPSIAQLPGGYVIVWQSLAADGYDIYMQGYTDAGVPVGGETRVNSIVASDQVQATVVAGADGGFAIAWASSQAAGGSFDYAVRLQAFDAQGVRVGGETQVNTSDALGQEHPGIAALHGGGYVVTWWSDSATAEGPGIYTRLIGANGAAVGSEVRLDTTSAGPQSAPAVTGLEGGGYVVTWDGTSGIHAQRFDANGAALAPEARIDNVAAGAIAKPVAAALADGGYVIAWHSAAEDGSGLDVHAQRFGADGAATGPQTIVNTTLAGHQTSPAITAMPDGGYVIAWTSTDQDGSGDGVFAQRFDAAGNAVGSENPINNTTALNQADVSLAPAHGGYVAAWISQEADGRSWDVFASAVQDGSMPPLRSVVPATEGNDMLVGTWDDNACVALGGDDMYLSQGGSDYFDGGDGLDTFVLPDSLARVTSYTLENGTLTLHTSDAHNAQATPIILATERIEFSDALFALDTQGPSGDTPAGHVWQAAALLHAAFGTAPSQSALSQWTAQADASSGMGQLGQKMIDAYAPGISSTALVAHLYETLTGHAPSAATVNEYASQIGAGKTFATQGDAFAYAANLPDNAAEVAGLIGTVQQLDPAWF